LPHLTDIKVDIFLCT